MIGDVKIAKTKDTKRLETAIWKATKKQGLFGCFEVTIGWFGKERVDYITYDTKGIWRCYEIKVSKSDFHSKAKKTFVGHYNYFVLTNELYGEVRDDIPNHIGAYVGGSLVKRAKKQELGVDEQILKDSIIRSLYRESEKILKSEDETVIAKMQRQINYEKRMYNEYYIKYWDLLRNVEEKYGTDWNKKTVETYFSTEVE